MVICTIAVLPMCAVYRLITATVARRQHVGNGHSIRVDMLSKNKFKLAHRYDAILHFATYIIKLVMKTTAKFRIL